MEQKWRRVRSRCVLVVSGLWAMNLFAGACSSTSRQRERDNEPPAAGGAAGAEASAGSGGSLAAGGSGGEAGESGASDLCPPRQHRCATGCVPDDDVATCGASCTPCARPQNGSATCDGARCGAECPPGTQLCAGACIDESSECDRSCPAETHECDGQCPSIMSVNACGDSCEPCPVPEGAVVAYCDGVECGFVCGTGLHACDGACALDSDPEACGDECQVCPGIENGNPTCIAGSCGVEC